MSKSAKRRVCPAVGHEILSAECGENRASRYACPADCPYSPFAPANYEQLLDLEGLLDRKTLEWWFDTASDRGLIQAGMDAAASHRSPHALHAFVAREIFFRRDASGATCARRWEATGLPGLRNDERVLFRSKLQVRVTLLEVRRVLDAERTEAVDLLQPPGAPLLILDRGLARRAVRFAPFVGWVYPLPHYWRMHGTAIYISDMGPFEPVEFVSEIVRHLGGPSDVPGLQSWLVESFVRFDEAVQATAQARHQDMLAGLDAKWGRAVYELMQPLEICSAALDANSAVNGDPLTDQEHGQGFVAARVWFADREDRIGCAAAGREVLGRLLIGRTALQLEALGQRRLACLRERVEAALGKKVRFIDEKLDDVAARLAQRRLPFEEALVPPRLRQQPQQLIMGFSRSPAPASPQSKEQTEAELITLQYRAFLDTTVPALGDRTPREAAGEPELRPRLIHLLKDSVRRHDERNLRSGRADDINWLLRELGATEILFDPPPRREPLGDVAEDDEDDLPGALPGLPDPPPLPDEPFDFHEAIRRFGIEVDAFDNACEAFEELAACGSTLLADVRVLVDDLLDEFEFSLAALLLARVAFAFAPPGTRQPALNFDRMAETFEGGFADLQRIMPSQNPDSFVQFLEQGAQPALMKLLIAQVLRLGADGPKKVRPSALTQTVMLVLLRAVVDELDRAMREQAAAA